VVVSLVATSDQGSAFGNRKLFKKSLTKNFVWGDALKKLEQKLNKGCY
jgi:hypothetical protein